MKMSLYDFLNWLLGAGGSISAASFILERIPQFQQQSSETKNWIFYGVSTIISLSAYAIITNVSVDVLNQIQPYFMIVSGMFITVIIGKAFHKLDKK